MHAVTRTYSGQGAKELVALFEQRSTEIGSLIRTAAGFHSYTLIRTEDGGASVTVCQDKAGCDQSLQIARDWVEQNAADLTTTPPIVSEGAVLLQLG